MLGKRVSLRTTDPFSLTNASNKNFNYNRQVRQHNRGKVKSGRVSVDKYDDPRSLSINSELKYTDTLISSFVSASGTWTKLTFPSQGVTSVTRVADRAHLMKIEMTGQIFTLGTFDSFRMIVLQTKGLFTSPPATTDVLASASPLAPYAYNARDLYEILYDDLISISQTGDTAINILRKAVKPKIKNLKFVPGSVNPYDGQVYVLTLCSTSANISHIINLRLWFEDGN